MARIVVGGIIEKENRFLLVQEAKKSCRGKWNIPAGHLEANETILDGAKREIFEECGCKVELTGVLEIGNRVLKDDAWVSVIFSAELIDENIKFNKEEVLDVKWFSCEEILAMKNELRDYELITNAILAASERRIANLDLVKVVIV